TRGWFWKNSKELNQAIDDLPHGPPWYRRMVRVTGDCGEAVLDLWMRDVVELVQFVMRNRRFMRDMRFAPERHFTSAEQTERNLLGEYATIAPIILSTDKTHLTVFSGGKKAWPVYLTIRNVSKELRRQPSERATLLVGFIPVDSLSCISNKKKRQERGWQLFHKCMESILEPLKTVSETGVEMLCADGVTGGVYSRESLPDLSGTYERTCGSVTDATSDKGRTG
ncbi:hypothetical protein FRC10_007574, partial [Ceratobasidium sp. 414]